MNFVQDALGVFKVPACVFEVNGTYVGGNDAIREFWTTHVDPDAKPGDWPVDRAAREFGIDMKAMCTEPTYSAHLPGDWVLHASQYDDLAGDVRTRPTLVVATLHGPETNDSWRDHQRVLITLRVNEMGEFTLHAIESSIHQAASAVATQRQLLKTYNARMAGLAGDREDSPKFFPRTP